MKRIICVLSLIFCLSLGALAFDIGGQAIFIGEEAFLGVSLGTGKFFHLRAHALIGPEWNEFRPALAGVDLVVRPKIGPFGVYGGAGIGALVMMEETTPVGHVVTPYGVGGVTLSFGRYIELYGEGRYYSIYHEGLPIGEVNFQGYGGGIRLRF